MQMQRKISWSQTQFSFLVLPSRLFLHNVCNVCQARKRKCFLFLFATQRYHQIASDLSSLDVVCWWNSIFWLRSVFCLEVQGRNVQWVEILMGESGWEEQECEEGAGGGGEQKSRYQL